MNSRNPASFDVLLFRRARPCHSYAVELCLYDPSTDWLVVNCASGWQSIARELRRSFHTINAARARQALAQIVGTVTITNQGEEVWADVEMRPDRALLATGTHLDLVAGAGNLIYLSIRNVDRR